MGASAAKSVSRNSAGSLQNLPVGSTTRWHGAPPCETLNQIHSGDAWLAQWVPVILSSPAYANGGALFIVWDESEGGDYPIGLIVLSAAVKGGGYSNAFRYTHSSLLRTLQEIFGVGPLLCDAARATALSDLFRVFP